MVKDLRGEMKRIADPKNGEFMQKFFSVEDRARGDVFLGLTVPQSRVIANKYRDLNREGIQELLKSDIHEERLIALVILCSQYKRADEKNKKELIEFYLKNTDSINHWDLVDSSAHQILGDYLLENKSRDILYKLAKSKIWWERRIAIIATFEFILRNKQTNDTYKIAEILLNDKHDLIQKAVGWMLREAGKRVSEEELVKFLKVHYKNMPRVMLRYSIEKFPDETRKKYLKGEI